MPTLRRRCPGCRRTLIASPAVRCPACERAYNQRRGSATARGLGADYQRNRALVLAASDVCWICHTRGADTADHVIPRVAGGTAALDNLRPAHGRCNAKRGSRGSI